MRTLVRSESSRERVRLTSSIKLCARTHLSSESCCISAYEAAIFAGRALDFGEGAREDGEGGTEEEARRECRMYFAESRSISCCNSREIIDLATLELGFTELTLGFKLLVLDLL